MFLKKIQRNPNLVKEIPSHKIGVKSDRCKFGEGFDHITLTNGVELIFCLFSIKFWFNERIHEGLDTVDVNLRRLTRTQKKNGCIDLTW